MYMLDFGFVETKQSLNDIVLSGYIDISGMFPKSSQNQGTLSSHALFNKLLEWSCHGKKARKQVGEINRKGISLITEVMLI